MSASTSTAGCAAVDPDSPRRRAYAFLSRVFEPGSLDVAAWLARTDVEDAAAALRSGSAPAEVLARAVARLDRVAPDQDLAAAYEAGARLVTPEDDEWPHFAFGAVHRACETRLKRREIAARRNDSFRAREGGEPTPPVALWVRGTDDLATAAVRAVAVVGSRASTAYGDHVAGDLARGLATRDVVVVSGGAYGIDASAHRGALNGGGRTWLVSAGGIERAYPARHAALYEYIAANGLLISEYPPGSQPFRNRFLLRNRLIAALSTATVVVEAAVRSGALNTLRHTYLLGRPALAVPGPVTSALSTGCHLHLRGQGGDGRAELVTTAAEIMTFVDGSDLPPVLLDTDPAVRGAEFHRRLDALDARARQVFDGLPRRGRSSEAEIAARCGLSAVDVARALPGLRLVGLVDSTDDGHRVATGVLSRATT